MHVKNSNDEKLIFIIEIFEHNRFHFWALLKSTIGNFKVYVANCIVSSLVNIRTSPNMDKVFMNVRNTVLLNCTATQKKIFTHNCFSSIVPKIYSAN